MALDPITAISDLVKVGLDKFVMDKGQREKLKADMEMHVMKEARMESGQFRDFVLQYEGAAKDVPRVIVLLRSLIPPAFTILIGYCDYLFFTGETTAWQPEAIALLKAVNVIILAFWFGERALKNSGIIELLIKKNAKQ